MALRRLALGVAGALRGAAQQHAAQSPISLAAAASLTAPAAAAPLAAAAAAARLFSSSSAAAAGSSILQRLAPRSSAAAAACSRLGSGSSSSGAAAAVAARAAGGPSLGAWLQQLRCRTDSSHLVPKFAGSKIKSYSSYKSRFKVTGTGKVVYARPGHVHKRFNKSKSQLLRLGGPLRVMRPRYAKVVRKLGFKTRNLS